MVDKHFEVDQNRDRFTTGGSFGMKGSGLPAGGTQVTCVDPDYSIRRAAVPVANVRSKIHERSIRKLNKRPERSRGSDINMRFHAHGLHVPTLVASDRHTNAN